MIARITAWLCVTAAALSLAVQTAVSQEVAPSTQPASTRWTGVLTGTNVYVRSGPGQQAYPCTKLSVPDRVIVIDKTDGWLRILAPKGCFSVISKDYVQLDAAGRTGTVTGDNVWVRAGGDLREANFIGVQRQLSRGDTVAVIGEVADYYKITPPDGAYFYISELYVRPAGAEAPAAPGAEEAEPLVPAPARLEVTAPAPAVPAKPSQAEKLAAFKLAEKVLSEEFAKPLEDRDLKKAASVYYAIPLTDDDPLKPYVDARMTFIRQTMRDMEALERVKELAKTTAERQAEYEAMRERLQRVTPPAHPLRLPAAKGVLQPSLLFPGTGAIAKRYLLIDPDTATTTAYVQSAAGDLDLDKYIGMNVAVYGTTTFDVSLQRDVVDPEEIEVLGAGGSLPSPPQPSIRLRAPATQPAAPAPPPRPTVRVAPVAPPPTVTVRPITPRPAVGVRPTTSQPTVTVRPITPRPAVGVRPTTPEPTTVPATAPATQPAPTTRPAAPRPIRRRPPARRPPESRPTTSRPATEPSPPPPSTAPAVGLPVVTDTAPAEMVDEEEYE